MLTYRDGTVPFGALFNTQCRKKLLWHNQIQNLIAEYLVGDGWNAKVEHVVKDEDSSYRFDVFAKKGKVNVVVEVKSELNVRDFGQIEAYILDVRKKFKQYKVYLGTDALNYEELIKGEKAELLLNLMNNYGLGLILVNPKQFWFFDAAEDLFNIEVFGDLHKDCEYCDGYFITKEGFEYVRKMVKGLKKSMGAKAFEQKFGIKIK